jgi:SAM-dependent methyltransferase
MQRRNFLALSLPALLTRGVLPAQYVEGRGEVPYVPTPEEVVEAMLKLAAVKNTDTVYDLGSGDGRIVITAAKTYGARGVGIDIDPERIAEANENAKKAGVTNRVRFIEKDLYEADIREATVVTLYLLSSVNLKLRPKLLSDLKPGTRVVSHQFDMGDWKPEKKVEIGYRSIYFWTIPQKKA